MKRLAISYIAIFALAAVSCVDDYQDANPPLPLDAPYAYVTSTIAPKKDGIPLLGDEEVTFSVNIVDAPGTLDAIDFIFSKGGEVVSHTFDQIVGQTSGSFDVTVKAPLNLDGATTFTMEIRDKQPEPKVLTISRVLDVSYLYAGPEFTVEIDDADDLAFEGDVLNVKLDITDIPSGAIASISVAGSAGTVVFDQEELDALIGKKSGTISGTLEVGPVGSTGTYNVAISITDELQNRQILKTAQITLVCPSAIDVSGTYKAYAQGTLPDSEEDEDDDEEEYTNLLSTVTITKINDGQYTISDLSFGVYPEFYDADAPEGVLYVCGFDVSGDPDNADEDDALFTITGSVVEATPDIITLEWENEWGDTGTVTLVKQ